MTLREQIIQAAIAALIGQTEAASRVYRSKAQALERDELPAVVVRPGQEDVKRLGMGVDQHDLEIKLHLYGRGETADAVLDPIHDAANRALMTMAQSSGLIRQIRLDQIGEPDFDDNDDTTTCVVMTYVATYATPQHDLTRSAG